MIEEGWIREDEKTFRLVGSSIRVRQVSTMEKFQFQVFVGRLRYNSWNTLDYAKRHGETLAKIEEAKQCR